jgi:hypothetical protein
MQSSINTSLFFIFLTCLWSACNSTLEDPARVDSDELLVLSAAKSAAPLSAKVRVYARVPKGAGLLDIAFATTNGVFEESGGKTVKQLTDSIAGGYRFAPVWLSSVKASDTVYVTAEVSNLRKRVFIVFN